MSRFKLTIAYDGSGFVGWQRQASGISIQGLVEDALGQLDGRSVAVAGAGRTDAGVHALGQVASCDLRRDIDGATLVRAMNARLPPAVRVLRAAAVPDTFHARFDAVSKTYRYRIWSAEVMSPFECAFAWHVPMRLDVDAMSEAARLLEGRHDFAAFQAAGTDIVTTERHVTASRIIAPPWDPASAGFAPPEGGAHNVQPLVTYEITGDGFLRHMVRAIVGTLVDIGRGRHGVAWMGEVLALHDRGRAGQTAPAEGLCLVSVAYRP